MTFPAVPQSADDSPTSVTAREVTRGDDLSDFRTLGFESIMALLPGIYTQGPEKACTHTSDGTFES